MTRTTRIAILAGVLISAVAFAAQDAMTIKRSLTEGATETYKMEASLTTNLVTPMGPQDMAAETAATVAVKVGKVDNSANNADVEATTTIQKLQLPEMMGGGGDQKLPDPATLKGKLDTKGRLKLTSDQPENVLMTALSGMNMASMVGLVLELPDKAVKVGDTWTVTVPANTIMKTDQTVTAKLVGNKEMDGTSALEVSVTGTLNTEIADGTMPESVPTVGGQPFTLKGTVDVTGTGFINPTTGQTLKLDLGFKGKQTITLTTLGLEVQAESELKTKSTLQK